MVERDLVEVGVGLTGEHLHAVAEDGEFTREMADVDALATAVGFAPVGQQSDAHARPSFWWKSFSDGGQ